MNILSKNLLILASAGSGKTFQLGNRVIGLIARGAAPEKIVALTFTRKAAGEFADSVLNKLAEAAADSSKAQVLRKAIATPNADAAEILERVVRALPRFNLGTMDGFFAKIVRTFQYELGLTGGKFELMEGPRAAMIAEELLTRILGGALDGETAEQFFRAFRRASYGREGHSVSQNMRNFVKSWQGWLRQARNCEWGPEFLAAQPVESWAANKQSLAEIVLGHLDEQIFPDKRQRPALEKAIAALDAHVIGSGSLGGATGLLAKVLDAASCENAVLSLSYYKEFSLTGPAADALREMVRLAAACEASAAVSRTRALREVVTVFDDCCDLQLRRRGLLNFDDVKHLMGEWMRDGDARERREWVDFRMDARIDHWLLDEFQDTSREDWAGLENLVGEAASRDDGTFFVVGDRKQAIYAWRGGDVRLFDDIMSHYAGNLEISPMADSWRSCPQVLELVNKVCGDVSTLRTLFGPVADRWQWDEHVSAEPLQSPARRGLSSVEVIKDWENRLLRTAEILREIQVGNRAVTCGILLRGNDKAREVADFLRLEGFDVVEDGRRKPALDHPVGLAILHLLQWLANPADSYAREVVGMSPLRDSLRAAHGDDWAVCWDALTTQSAKIGFSKMVFRVIEGVPLELSPFGQRRAAVLVAALAEFDLSGGHSPREAADWLTRLEISQAPGEAAVQVMTIHKSKGLGFDVVILPEIPDEIVPNPLRFEVAQGPGWLCGTPPKWVRALIPELSAAENQWAAEQRYEAFCTLYVALTRAKRALYVLLEPSSDKADPEKPSLANWIRHSLGGMSSDGECFMRGDGDWHQTPQPLASSPQRSPHPQLPAAAPRVARITPSAAKKSSSHAPHSVAGMKFGSEVHALLETVAWMDETTPIFPETDAGRAANQLLQSPEISKIFQRAGRPVSLFREQALSAMIDGKLLSGAIDRLHLHRDAGGAVTRVEIIDYKTDSVAEPADLSSRYAAQMEAYRRALQMMYPAAQIECLLISVHHAEIVIIEGNS